MRCDSWGDLYSIAPDGSFHGEVWGDYPTPVNCRVIRWRGDWTVIDGMGCDIGRFDTRQSARNFVKHYGG